MNIFQIHSRMLMLDGACANQSTNQSNSASLIEATAIYNNIVTQNDDDQSPSACNNQPPTFVTPTITDEAAAKNSSEIFYGVNKCQLDWEISKDVIECVLDVVDRAADLVDDVKMEEESSDDVMIKVGASNNLQLSPAQHLHRKLFGEEKEKRSKRVEKKKNSTQIQSFFMKLASQEREKSRKFERISRGLSEIDRAQAKWLFACNVPVSLISQKLAKMKKIEPKSKTAKENNNYQSGMVMWGKLSGHAWWPCKISNVLKSKTAQVQWFYNKTTSTLPFSKLLPFEKHLNQKGKKIKSQTLRQAVQLAKSDYEEKFGEILDE